MLNELDISFMAGFGVFAFMLGFAFCLVWWLSDKEDKPQPKEENNTNWRNV